MDFQVVPQVPVGPAVGDLDLDLWAPVSKWCTSTWVPRGRVR